MPYIDKATKDELLSTGRPGATPGELTYLLYREVLRYARGRGWAYSTFAEILGALEATKLELYRRVVAPYEDQKILQNGDVEV